MLTEARAQKKAHISTINDDCGSTCTDDCGSMCMNVSTDITSVQGSTCPYISTKGTDLHICTSKDVSMGETVVRGITNTYDV